MIIGDHSLLLNICRDLQQKGRTIVLASGAFDLLHVGHIRYLHSSKKEGDILVVAVNSDESVLSYKHATVLQPLQERMEIIDAIKGVDIVTYFDEPTAHKIVDIVRPNVHSKGTEYSADSLPEYEYLIQLGIKVVFVGDKKTHSSSALGIRSKAIIPATTTVSNIV